MEQMTAEEVEIFEAANKLDDDTALTVLNEAVPDRAEAIATTLNELRSELLDAEDMIIREVVPTPQS